MPVRRIVLGHDGSEGAARACRWCADLAHALSAEVVVVHAMDLPAYPVVTYEGPLPVPLEPGVLERWQEERRALVETTWCAPLRRAGVTHRVQVVDADPATAILETADTERADLVVVGRRGEGTLGELVLGSVSHQLTHHAHQPVTVVPHEHGDGREHRGHRGS
jgi:nucleotide-binding universal stress UspA family protein